MKIKAIEAVRLNAPQRELKTQPRRHPGPTTPRWPTPCRATPRSSATAACGGPSGSAVWCKVTAEDGTWGLGALDHGRALPR